MEFNERQIARPKNWQTFEDLCLDLFRRVWRDPTAQKNGRQGQPQHGTDIYGQPDYRNNEYHGVQCKGKDDGLGAAVTESELRKEIEKAKKFSPPLSEWILATTAPKDTGIEEVARLISAEHQANGLFRVQVYGWEDLQSLIADFSEIMEKYYPEQAPRMRRMLSILESLPKPIRDLGTAITIARTAAARDLQNFRREDGGRWIVLDLEEQFAEVRRPVSQPSIICALEAGKVFILEAEPGAGKSTTVLRLADGVLSGAIGSVPIVLPLPELAIRRRGLLDEIVARASFRDLDRAALSLIAEAGRLILLCDGWNELSGGQRNYVRHELDSYRREFPGSGLLVATRTLSPIPFERSSRLFLQPLTRAQQHAMLAAKLGGAAEELLTRARRVPGLRAVLRIPLYITALAEIGANGAMPSTKEQVISRFIDAHEAHAEHRDSLFQYLKRSHSIYLRRIAKYLVETEAIAITEHDLREQISRVSADLKAAWQIGTPPEPEDAIDVLVSHHVLVEREEDDGRLFAFQHQQFQEWYASFEVADCIIGTSQEPQKYAERLRVHLDHPFWEESVLFAVERLSSQPGNVTAISRAILLALGIDPMLAAAMIERTTPEVWEAVASTVTQFVECWLDGHQADRAYGFMIATGEAEFADRVWAVIEDAEQYDRISRSHGSHFNPTVLGRAALQRLGRLPPERRRAVLWDIVYQGGQAGLEFAVAAAKAETSPEVVASVADTLLFYAAETDIKDVLSHASQEVWDNLALRHRLEDLPEGGRGRVRGEKRRLVQSLPAGRQRLHLLMELDELGDANAQNVVGEAFAVEAQDYQATHSTLDRVASRYPERLSDTIVERLVQNLWVPVGAAQYVMPGKTEHQDALRLIASDQSSQDRHRKETAARALDAASVKSLIAELIPIVDTLAATPNWTDAAPFRERYGVLSDALHCVPLSALVTAILDTDASHPRHIAAMAELLYRWYNENRDQGILPLEDAMGERLCRRVDEWTTRIVAHPEMTRHQLSELATAIKRIGRPELLQTLHRLLTAELEAWRRDQAAKAAARQQTQNVRPPVQVNYLYFQIYQQAFDAFNSNAARDVLLGYLGDPDFEVQAAFALRKYGTCSALPSDVGALGPRPYGRIAAARRARISTPGPVNPVAGAVLDRIDRLVAQGSPDDIQSAVSLATAAAQMDYGDRGATLHATVRAAGAVADRYGLLAAMLMSGECVDADLVRQGLDGALARVAGESWRAHETWWQVDQWLQLLVFSNSPRLVVERVARLPLEFRRAHNLDGIISAVGFTEPADAVVILSELRNQMPDIVTRHTWITALEQIGTEAAAQHLLDLALNDQVSIHSGLGAYGVIRALSTLLRKHATVKRGLLQRLSEPHSAATRYLITEILREILDADEVMQVLEFIRAEQEDPLQWALLRAVEQLAVPKREIPERPNWDEHEPANLASLRARLFEVIVGNGPKANFAAKLLTTIDQQRDEHGHPPSEPRHPNLHLNIPWPLEAKVAWEAL